MVYLVANRLFSAEQKTEKLAKQAKETHCNTLQHCNTRQHTTTNCNTHCNTHCNTYCNTHCNTHCNIELLPAGGTQLQHTRHAAKHCNTLQDTATHTATHYTTKKLPAGGTPPWPSIARPVEYGYIVCV